MGIFIERRTIRERHAETNGRVVVGDTGDGDNSDVLHKNIAWQQANCVIICNELGKISKPESCIP